MSDFLSFTVPAAVYWYFERIFISPLVYDLGLKALDPDLGLVEVAIESWPEWD